MNVHGCPHETAVAEAARSGRWTDELVAHSHSCVACAEIRLVAGFLRHEALAAAPEPLPDPGLIWWRSKLESRREVARKATVTITAVQILAAAFAAGLGLKVLVWMWPAIRQMLGAAGKALTPATLSAGSADPALVILVCGVVIGAMVLRELAIARAR